MDHQLLAAMLALAAVLSAAAASLGTRVQLLPDVIDLSFILTVAGLGGLVGAAYGALRGDESDRVARRSLHGTLYAGGLTALILFPLLVAEIL